MPKKVKSSVRFQFYPTYNFGGDYDPAIDAVKTALQDTGISVAEVAMRARISRATLNKWLDGQTISPRHATLAAALGAVGKRFVIEDVIKGRQK